VSKKAKRKCTPSLIERESSGGETAQKGFVFQEGVLLSQLPKWLAYEGFTALTCESIGDIEVKFFTPASGVLLDLWETKDHQLTPTEFWGEIARFFDIYTGSPGTYRSFTLASVGLSTEIRPIGMALRRVRNPYDFYGPGSPVITKSYRDFENRVLKAGHTKEKARFVFDRVVILPDFPLARHDMEALFRQAAYSWLPEFRDLTGRQVGTIFSRLESLVSSGMNHPIFRKEIEAAIAESLGQVEASPPISICTTTESEHGRQTDLCLDWADFFRRKDYQYPPPTEWNTRLLGQLRETHRWILEHRSARRIRLSGSRRLSAALAIGSVFSAVSGFAIDLEYRGDIWSTDAHPKSSTPEYEFTTGEIAGNGRDLVVAIGIGRDILRGAKAAIDSLGLEGSALLYIFGKEPIVSPEQANGAVAYLKQAISERLAQTAAGHIHLFFSGPSHTALFFGHRLNATVPVQCYEWIGKNTYVPTCRLYANG
jgi:hypothetical protein